MRVILFPSPLGRPYRLTFPYSLCCLATVLKENHRVIVSDPNVAPDYEKYIRDLIADFKPDVIGVSLRNIDTVRIGVPWLFSLPFKQFLGELKVLAPGAVIIAGGSGFSIFPREIMTFCKEIDFGVYLEAEESLPELLDRLDRPETVKGIHYRKNGEILFTGNRTFPDISRMPVVDRSFVDFKAYTKFPYDVGVETKRGCGLTCAYCSYPRLNGSRLRLRATGQIVDEIEELVKRYKLTTFSFIDSVFDIPRDHCIAICREILRRGLKVNWLGWFNGAGFDEAFFLLALEAGCNFFAFSPDGYTTRTLKGLHKRIRHKDIKRIYSIFRKHGDKGAKVTFNFFANSPDMRFVDFLRTLAFCLRAKFMLGKCLHRAGMDYIRILPGTELYEMALEKKIINPETSLFLSSVEGFEKLFYHEPGTKAVDFFSGLFKGLKGKGYAK